MYTYCNTLQLTLPHTATDIPTHCNRHCNTLQPTYHGIFIWLVYVYYFNFVFSTLKRVWDPTTANHTATHCNSRCNTRQLTLQHTATDSASDTATRCNWHIIETSDDFRDCAIRRWLFCTECVIKKQKHNDGGWAKIHIHTYCAFARSLTANEPRILCRSPSANQPLELVNDGDGDSKHLHWKGVSLESVCCSCVFQCVDILCKVLAYRVSAAVCCSVSCSVLQCRLQCVAVCCSVLQCVTCASKLQIVRERA